MYIYISHTHTHTHIYIYTHNPPFPPPHPPTQAKEKSIPSLEAACGERAQEREEAAAAVEAIMEGVKGEWVRRE
jgi:hypothetical protein